MRDKGRGISSRKILIRETGYDAAKTRTVIPIYQIRTAKSETKRKKMVCIRNTPGEDDRFRLKPDSSSCIYMTLVKDNECRIVENNRRK